MSFGWSAGELVAVVQLAWETYAKYRDAPEEYFKLRDEIFAFHSLLKPLRHDSATGLPPTSQSDSDTSSAWNSILSTCKNLLQQALKLLETCPRVASRIWDRLRFSRITLEPIRQQLHVYISLLDSHIAVRTGRLMVRVKEDTDGILKTVTDVKSDTAQNAELMRRLEKKLNMVLERTDANVKAQIKSDKVLQNAQHDIERSLRAGSCSPMNLQNMNLASSLKAHSPEPKLIKPLPNAGWSEFFLNGTNWLVIEDLYNPSPHNNYFRKPPILEIEPLRPLPLGWFRIESPAGRVEYTFPEENLHTMQHPSVDLSLLPAKDYMSSGSYLASAGRRAADLVRARQFLDKKSQQLRDKGKRCELSNRCFRIINCKLHFDERVFGCEGDKQWKNCQPAPGEPHWRELVLGLSLETLREVRELTNEEKLTLSGSKYGDNALDMLGTYQALLDSNIKGDAYQLTFTRNFFS